MTADHDQDRPTDDRGDSGQDRLALLDPLARPGARGTVALPPLSRADRDRLVDHLLGEGTVVALHRRRRSRGLAGLLVAASVVALVVGGGVLVERTPGGAAGVRAAARALVDPGSVDRYAERAAYQAWVDDTVACLRRQHGPAVQPVPGGFHVEQSLLRPDAEGNRTFGTTACAYEVGEAPRPEPLTDAELGRLFVEQVAVAACLRGTGLTVGPGPSAERFAAGWRDPSPAAPPWTPYASVDLADLQEAQEACGTPDPPAPPAWARGSGPRLEDARAGATGATATPAVAFVDADAAGAVARSWARCLNGLGVSAVVDGERLSTQNDDPDLDALCFARYPPRPRPESTGTAVESLRRTWEHRADEVAPCLREEGVDVPEPPTFEEFLLQGDSGRAWDPWSSVTAADAGDPRAMDRLRDTCPGPDPTDP